MWKALAVLALLFSVTVPASAETEINLAGTWTITVDDGPECEFGGQAKVTRTEDGYSAELIMRHACPAFPNGSVTALQTSKLTVTGKQVSVRSEIIDFPIGDWSNTYAPDHFALSLQPDGRLFGIQTDWYGTKPAEWKRSEAGIS